MKNHVRKALSMLLLLSMILTIGVSATDTRKNSTWNEFDILVCDTDNNPIHDADVYVYSLQDREIVASGITDKSGKCLIEYMPEISSNISMEERSHIYKDYMIYVMKDGFDSMSSTLTKYYGLEDENVTSIDISLPESVETVVYSNNRTDNKLYPYMQDADGDLPFYVIFPEDMSDVVPYAVNDNSITYWNVNLPIGYFHTNTYSKLDVTFSTSDAFTVKSGTKSDSGVFSISGSITRKFGSTTQYPTFIGSGTHGLKKQYSTVGTMMKYYTIDGPSGRTNEHYVLSEIVGGTVVSNTGIWCDTCNVDYNTANNNQHGTCIPISNGGSVAIENFKGVDLGTTGSVSLSKFGITQSLDVSFKTSRSTVLKYTPVSGYNIRVYDEDFTHKTWHVTSVKA